MIINQAALQGIYRSFKVLFQKAFETAKPLYEKVATVVPSTTREEAYKWLGKVPRMREWIGDRVIQNLAAFDYTIKNKSWESTVSVDRDDIEDDTIGLYSPLVQSVGNAAATHPDEIVFGLLPDGFTKLCYDGQYFFDTDHKDVDGPVQSNKGTAALSHASYAAARSAMMALLDEKGNPLGIMPTLLVVPPQLEETGKKILTAELVPETVGETTIAVSNVNKGTAELLVVPWLAGHPTKWFLLDVSKPIKPLIFQQRKKPEFVAMDASNDTNVFMRKEYIYGVDCRDNAGFGLWQMAYGSTGAG